MGEPLLGLSLHPLEEAIAGEQGIIRNIRLVREPRCHEPSLAQALEAPSGGLVAKPPHELNSRRLRTQIFQKHCLAKLGIGELEGQQILVTRLGADAHPDIIGDRWEPSLSNRD